MKPESKTLSPEAEDAVREAAGAYLAVIRRVEGEVIAKGSPRELQQVVQTIGLQAFLQAVMTEFRPPDDAPDAFHAALFETAMIGAGLAIGNLIGRVPEGPSQSAALDVVRHALVSAIATANKEARKERIAAVQGEPN